MLNPLLINNYLFKTVACFGLNLMNNASRRVGKGESTIYYYHRCQQICKDWIGARTQRTLGCELFFPLSPDLKKEIFSRHPKGELWRVCYNLAYYSYFLFYSKRA